MLQLQCCDAANPRPGSVLPDYISTMWTGGNRADDRTSLKEKIMNRIIEIEKLSGRAMTLAPSAHAKDGGRWTDLLRSYIDGHKRAFVRRRLELELESLDDRS